MKTRPRIAASRQPPSRIGPGARLPSAGAAAWAGMPGSERAGEQSQSKILNSDWWMADTWSRNFAGRALTRLDQAASRA